MNVRTHNFFHSALEICMAVTSEQWARPIFGVVIRRNALRHIHLCNCPKNGATVAKIEVSVPGNRGDSPPQRIVRHWIKNRAVDGDRDNQFVSQTKGGDRGRR